MQGTTIKWTIIGALLAGLTACAAYRDSDRADQLDKSVRVYSSLIRWGDFRGANQFRKQPENGDVVAQRLKDVRVTNYEIRQVNYDSEQGTGSAVVEFEYHGQFSARIRTIVDRQKWVYNEEPKGWRLDGELPPFEGVGGR